MKNILFISLAAILLIFVIGCRKDEVIVDTNTNPPIPIVVDYTDAEVYGRITNRTGENIADATVTWGNETTQTDENGFFQINASVKERNAILKIEKEGFFKAIQTLQVIENVKAKTTVKLTPRVLSGTLSSIDGGSIETNSNGKIDFAANAFVDVNGNVYSGEVNVFAYYLDPTIDDLYAVMPGNLTSVDAQNTPQLLTSYGMMNVELEDNMGNPLQISTNATLTTPVPATLQGNAPAMIPLWYFDTEAGTWREEGSATLEGGVYVGEVAHFTWWNCDVPQNFIYLEGQIDGGVAGTPVLTVKITEISSGQYGIMNTYDKGNFAGPVPKNQALLLEVFSSCGDLLHMEEIGIFSEDTELSIISIDISGLDWLSFTGNLTDCDGNPVADGYVVLSGVNSSIGEVLIPNNQGFVSVTLADCANGEVTYFGVDLNSYEASEETTITLTEDTQVGDIVACGNEVEESFNITIASETMTWLPCTAVINNGGGDGESVITISTTHIQESGSVDYNITYFEWMSPTSNEPEWLLSYETNLIGNPEIVYGFNSGFSGVVDLEILANGEVAGSLLHMIHSDVTVENTANGTFTEGCTMDIKATIQ